MAYEIPLGKHSREAGVDLSAKQFFFMAIAADGQVDPCGDGLQSVGVLQNKPSVVGAAAELQTLLISKVVAGEAIAINDAVASGAAGKAKTATGSDIVMGIALEAASGDGEIISVLLGQSRLTARLGDAAMISGADLSSKQFLFHAVAADGKVDPATAGVMCAGILQNAPAAADLEALVRQAGLSDVISSEAFTMGDALSSDAVGKARIARGGDVVQAIALETASAADETISVLLGQDFVEDGVSLISGADLSSKQFLFHAMGPDGKIDPSGDGLVTCGVLQNAPAAVDLVANCKQIGVSNVISADGWEPGTLLASDATGKAKTAVQGDFVQAVGIGDPSGADETVEALLIGSGHVVP